MLETKVTIIMHLPIKHRNKHHQGQWTVIVMHYRPIGLNNVQGGPKKRHKVYSTITLQPYSTDLCDFQENVPQTILYMTKVNV